MSKQERAALERLIESVKRQLPKPTLQEGDDAEQTLRDTVHPSDSGGNLDRPATR